MSELFNDYLVRARGVTRNQFDKWPREAQTEVQAEFIRNLTLSRSPRSVDPRCMEDAKTTQEEYDRLRRREQAEAEAAAILDGMDPVKLIMRLPLWVQVVIGVAFLLVVAWYAVAWGGETVKFRKKPIIVDAIQFTGVDNYHECLTFMGREDANLGYPEICILIPTLEGEMRADPGDFIIREPFPRGDRQFYPCKRDIFFDTYELVTGMEP